MGVCVLQDGLQVWRWWSGQAEKNKQTLGRKKGSVDLVRLKTRTEEKDADHILTAVSGTNEQNDSISKVSNDLKKTDMFGRSVEKPYSKTQICSVSATKLIGFKQVNANLQRKL